MSEGRRLAETIWPAINIAVMDSQAWAICFEGEFRHHHYREIVNVVFFNAARSMDCPLGQLRAEIADAFQINDKTVAARIDELKTGGLLDLLVDKSDLRRTLVKPTQKLIDAYAKYSDLVVEMQLELASQLEKRDRPQRTHKPAPEIHFDLLDHVQEQKTNGDLRKPDVAVVRPVEVQVSKARK